jgi:murein DD-endopeptidase MepM/ murein hydrolase activator NlpD
MADAALTWSETFGLSPLPARLREMLVTFRGAEGVPPSRFDATSLGIFQPRLALETWLGRRRTDRRVPIYNLFNRTPTPITEGWSVRRTQVRDFRGGALTYDSHNGTDFAVPPGTTVVAAAPGRVLRVSSEFNRGGLKVFVDHGDGLVTTSNHLARALVTEGDVVRRGQPIALSGASGIDMVLMFPWNTPHVHFNVWLDGEPVDPFAAPGETALWRRGNDPAPDDGTAIDAGATSTEWDAARIADGIASCRVGAVRDALGALEPLAVRAMGLLFQMNYYPTRFAGRPRPYATSHARTPRLDLPFAAEDVTGIVFPE